MKQYVVQGQPQLQRVADLIRSLSPDKPWSIEVKRHQERRTLSQNKLYFAILTEIERETGNDKEAIHEAMKKKFLPPQTVTLGDEEVMVPGSSAKCGKQAFSEFVEKVCAFAATELGLTV